MVGKSGELGFVVVAVVGLFSFCYVSVVEFYWSLPCGFKLHCAACKHAHAHSLTMHLSEYDCRFFLQSSTEYT